MRYHMGLIQLVLNAESGGHCLTFFKSQIAIKNLLASGFSNLQKKTQIIRSNDSKRKVN